MKCAWVLIVAVLPFEAKVQGSFDSVEYRVPPVVPQPTGGSAVSTLTREYAVLLRLQKDYREYVYCTGVRLNERWMLTAAECLEEDEYTHIQFTFPQDGRFVQNYTNFKSLHHVIHPDYDPNTNKDNIALIESNFVQWKNQSRHLKLPLRRSSLEVLVSTTAELTFFKNSFDHETNEIINALSTFTVELEYYTLCNGLYARTTATNNQICATSAFTGHPRLLSKENLGAPLVLKDRTLYGIVLEVKPLWDGFEERMVLSKISPYLKWINNVTGIPIS